MTTAVGDDFTFAIGITDKHDPCWFYWFIFPCETHIDLNLPFDPFAQQDPHAEEFEDKEWTFVIENVSNDTWLEVI